MSAASGVSCRQRLCLPLTTNSAPLRRIFVGRWGLYWRAVKLCNRRLRKAVAATVRLHNVCVEAFLQGEGDEWSVETERMAREHEIKQAAVAEQDAELASLADGGTHQDSGPHSADDVVRRGRLDAEQQAAAEKLLAAREKGAARRRRKRRERQHPEHAAAQRHRPPPRAAAADRAEQIAASLSAAGESRAKGKAAASVARAVARRRAQQAGSRK